jgi:hypothetical protein
MMSALQARAHLRVGHPVLVNHRPVFSTAEGPNWHDAVVVDLLSEQFTAECDGAIRFYFYKDFQDTWRLA